MTEEEEITSNSKDDSADRLLSLINQLEEAITKPFGDGHPISRHPLSKSFDKIAEEVGYPDYISFLQDFMALSQRVQNDLEVLEFNRESVRDRASDRIRDIKSLFSAENFEIQTGKVFRTYLSEENKGALDDLSDRFRTADLTETSLDDLTEALNEINELGDFCVASGKLSSRAKKLIALHITQLKSILEHYDQFGETKFWDHYRILFSTFMELHSVVVEEGKNKDEFNKKMKKILSRLLVGSSLAANVVTIGTIAVPLLS